MKKTLIQSTRKGRPLLAGMLAGAMLFLGSCVSGRAGITHDYSTPYGQGSVYVEGSSYGAPHHPGGHHKPPKPPKPPKKKKHKEKKPKPPKPPKHKGDKKHKDHGRKHR